MFGRKKKQDGSAEEVLDPAQAEEAAIGLPAEPAPELSRPQGPWDVADVPDDDVQRIDLGGLRIPVPDGTEVRVDVSPEGEVVAATLVQGDSQMQVNAFAAPRRSGIWAEVRAEIAAALTQGGGKAEEAEGSYGPELLAQVPSEEPGGAVVLAPARFLGVDGPRWFLRALLTGAAGADPAAGAGLEAVLRDLVVVRGGEAMAVRDPLPLHLPTEVAEQAAAAAEEQGLALPERGPEITETR